MAEEERTLRRNKKIAGIDDPVIIVQRILNIFRQLHILDDKQKEDFNTMILRQPPEIRHMCSILPGGSLLQEYIDDLEESRGIAPDQKLDDIVTDMDAPQETILAAALTDAPQEAQAQKNTAPTASATPVSNADSGVSNEDFQKQMLLMMQAMKNSTAPAPAVSGTITADANFAKEIAGALADALAASDEKRRQETQELTKSLTNSQLQMTKILVSQLIKNGEKSNDNREETVQIKNVSNGDTAQTVKVIDNTQEITKAITESQLQMAKMFLQQNAINAASSSNSSNANTIQINNAPIVPNHQEFIGDIVKAQSELFREMSKEQTKELATLIAEAIKESNKLSNKSLIEALSSFQRENLKFLEKQAQNQNQKVVYYQVPGAEMPFAPSAAMPQTPDATVPVTEPVYQPQSDNLAERTPSYIKKVLGNVFNRSKNEEDEQFVYSPETLNSISETYPSEDKLNTADTPATEDTEFGTEEATAETEIETFASTETVGETVLQTTASGNDISDRENELEIDANPLGLTVDGEVKKKKKKKKKNKNKNASTVESSVEIPTYAPIYAEDKADDGVLEEEPALAGGSIDDFNLDEIEFESLSNAPTSTKQTDSAFGLDSSLFDLDLPNSDFTTENPQEISIESTDDESSPTDLPKLDFSLLEIDNELNSESSMAERAYYTPVAKDFNDEVSFEEETSEEITVEAIPESTTVADEEIIPEEYGSVDTETIDSEPTVDLSLTPENVSLHTAIGTDVETEKAVKKSPSTLLNNLKNLSGLSGMFSTNIEEDAGEPLDLDADYKIDFDNPESENETDSDEDWEWEYEDNGEENIATAEITTPQTAENEEDEWEWEYEEVEDGNVPVEASAESLSDISDSETDNNEWEWEYEEVEEDNVTVEASAVPVSDISDSETDNNEWEWEYEEVEDENVAAEASADPLSITSDDEADSGDWEWEYEEVEEDNLPMKEETAFETAEPIPENAIDNNDEDQWVHEEVEKSIPAELNDSTVDEDIGSKLKSIDDGDLSALLDKFEQSEITVDPYQGNSGDSDNDLELASLQSGSLYFQEDVTTPAEDKETLKPSFTALEPEIVFSELGEEEENPNEPYKLNSDIKP